jgi:putative FmdB family regulatory protein
MPIYTYHCDSCGITFDQRQSFSDEPMKVCPECLEEALHKVYQPVGIVFKGKGFYATDHRSTSGASTASEKKSSESKSETSASTDTKPSTAKADTKEK